MGPDQDTEQEVPETRELEQEHRQTAEERSHANEVPASFDHGKYDEGGDYAIAELMALHGWFVISTPPSVIDLVDHDTYLKNP